MRYLSKIDFGIEGVHLGDGTSLLLTGRRETYKGGGKETQEDVKLVSSVVNSGDDITEGGVDLFRLQEMNEEREKVEKPVNHDSSLRFQITLWRVTTVFTIHMFKLSWYTSFCE